MSIHCLTSRAANFLMENDTDLIGGVRDIKQAHHMQIRPRIRAAAQDEGDSENEEEDEDME